MRPLDPESNSSPQIDEKPPEAGPPASGPDEAVLRVNGDATVSALLDVLKQDNANGASRSPEGPPVPVEPRPEASEEQGADDCSEGGGGLFGFPVSSGRPRT